MLYYLQFFLCLLPVQPILPPLDLIVQTVNTVCNWRVSSSCIFCFIFRRAKCLRPLHLRSLSLHHQIFSDKHSIVWTWYIEDTINWNQYNIQFHYSELLSTKVISKSLVIITVLLVHEKRLIVLVGSELLFR